MSAPHNPRRFMAHEIAAHNSVSRDPIGHHPAAYRWAVTVADALMSSVDGKPVEFSGPPARRPITRERAAHLAGMLARIPDSERWS